MDACRGMTLVGRTSEFVQLLQNAGVTESADAENGEPLSTLDDFTLLEGVRRLAEVRRTADAEHARFAAEVARRSPVGDEYSLARRRGERNAVALVARETGSGSAVAHTAVAVGQAITPRQA